MIVTLFAWIALRFVKLAASFRTTYVHCVARPNHDPKSPNAPEFPYQRFVSSNKCTRKASEASCKAWIACDCHLMPDPAGRNVSAISLTYSASAPLHIFSVSIYPDVSNSRVSRTEASAAAAPCFSGTCGSPAAPWYPACSDASCDWRAEGRLLFIRATISTRFRHGEHRIRVDRTSMGTYVELRWRV
jgi:hypothetical protein